MDSLKEIIWYCVRRDGVAKQNGWLSDVPLVEVPQRVHAHEDDVLEINVLRRSKTISLDTYRRHFFNRRRGMLGIEIRYRDKIVRYAPTQMIARNLSFDKLLERFKYKVRVSDTEFLQRAEAFSLMGRQFLIDSSSRGPIELTRGSTVVQCTSIDDTAHIESFASNIGNWMLKNLSYRHALPYKYWPSRGEISPADNALRRFLGTLALARLGNYRNCPRLKIAARDNLRYNLERYFRVLSHGCGAIVEDTGAKLGSAAIAGLAILENHYASEFAEELILLAKGVDSLNEGRNGFRTFFFPAERDGQNWNFYSGEALLFWAEAIRHRFPIRPSLDHCLSTFRICRRRHFRNRNPAFVPWGTQVCASLYAITQKQEFADSAFEMSDWLLPMQQWEDVDEDMKGRFYMPKRPDWGPPHAASTGAYCEGLADALAVASCVGDSRRVSSYSKALARGLRSLRQLQFKNFSDSYYISRKDRVLGALRTEVYDNSIRVDSAAHGLVAALKILQPSVSHRKR